VECLDDGPAVVFLDDRRKRGGGSFITLPSLMLTDMDARAANIASTVALFPAQLVTARAPERRRGLTMRTLFVISLVGGALGAVILLATPAAVFAGIWLVLFAMALFAWGSFFRKVPKEREGRLSLGPRGSCNSSSPSTAAISAAASAS